MSKKKEYVIFGRPDLKREDEIIKAAGPVDEAMYQAALMRIANEMFAAGSKREASETEMEEQARKLRIYNLEWRE